MAIQVDEKLEVLEFTHAPDLKDKMPPPREMLSATEKDGSTLEARQKFMKKRGIG